MFELGNALKNQLIDEHAENKYYNPNYELDMHDNNDSRSLIANYIRKNAKCLDVGCGAGYLGKALFKYKKADVYGIELDKEAAKYASKGHGYVDVYNFSITERAGKEFDKFIRADLKFDYIIFADILEHIISLDDALLFFSKFLKPNGRILVSLPNVAHLDVVRGLINGDFNYNHIGLLDNTHLRFFTERSFEQFIEQINEIFGQNFAIKVINKTMAMPNYIERYPNFYKILNHSGEACVLQFIYEISIEKKSSNGSVKRNRKKDYFAEIEERLRQRDELKREVKDLRESTSWKITKPIRKISAMIKDIKKS